MHNTKQTVSGFLWLKRTIGVRGVKEYWPGGKMLAYEVKNLILWPQSPKCCVHLVLATSGPIGRRVWSQGPFQKDFRFFGPFSKTRTNHYWKSKLFSPLTENSFTKEYFLNFGTVFLTAVNLRKLRKAHCSPPLVGEDNSMVFTSHSVPLGLE